MGTHTHYGTQTVDVSGAVSPLLPSITAAVSCCTNPLCLFWAQAFRDLSVMLDGHL